MLNRLAASSSAYSAIIRW